jgi:hypothetical protein
MDLHPAGDIWTFHFTAPRGARLARRTYPLTADPSGAGMFTGASGHGCTAAGGRFTIGEIAFDTRGLRTLVVSFARQCFGETPLLRGTFTFRAA